MCSASVAQDSSSNTENRFPRPSPNYSQKSTGYPVDFRRRGYQTDSGTIRRTKGDSLTGQRELGIERFEDWYHARNEDIRRLGGKRLLDEQYGGSLLKALSNIYPSHEWLPWRFGLPNGFWADAANQRSLFDWAGRKLGIWKPAQMV
eukprot:GEZU01002608.1.p1 GENE.GEZU01002608.1~~GEZU01002608.1.p1  ORF type:complete len:147 (+),score=13.18 GEZU01002608.1:184-624(+)